MSDEHDDYREFRQAVARELQLPVSAVHISPPPTIEDDDGKDVELHSGVSARIKLEAAHKTRTAEAKSQPEAVGEMAASSIAHEAMSFSRQLKRAVSDKPPDEDRVVDAMAVIEDGWLDGDRDPEAVLSDVVDVLCGEDDDG